MSVAKERTLIDSLNIPLLQHGIGTHSGVLASLTVGRLENKHVTVEREEAYDTAAKRCW